MKILYFITKSEAGGAQTHIYQLSKYFTEKGNEVGIMSYPGGWLEKETLKMGADFYSNQYLSNKPNPFEIFKAIKKIKEVVADFKPDLISCHSTAAGFLGRLTIRNKIPTIFTAHGWAFTEGAPFLRKVILLLAEKLAGCYCKKIICVSDFDRNLVLKYKIASPDKITVIHNGVEMTQINADIKQKDAEKSLKIVFVGRLTQPKDPLLLLKSFNSLSSKLRNKAQISIIGEGPRRKDLEKFIKGNKLEGKIKLLGSISREKVFEVLKKSDIFVLPSNYEGFPYTILEAMSCGLSVIASNVGGVSEIVDENCGMLIKRGDKEGLKKVLEKLIENPSLLLKLGENAKKRVKEEFSLGKMLEKTKEVYEKLKPCKKENN